MGRGDRLGLRRHAHFLHIHEGPDRSRGSSVVGQRYRAWRPDRDLDAQPGRVRSPPVRLRGVGAIATAINTRFRSFEVEHLLRNSGARLLVMVERFLKHDYIDTLTQVGVLPCRAGGQVANDDFPQLRTIVSLEEHPTACLLPWEQFLARGDRVPQDDVSTVQRARSWQEPVLLQYTSGTTAAPKGALLDHRYVLNVGRAVFSAMGVQPGEAIMNTQPFYHIGGSCGGSPTPLVLGCKVVTPRFYEPGRVLELIQRERCVARTGFAAMYIMEMGVPAFGDYDLSSLRVGWCTGPDSLMETVRDVYGMPGLVRTYSSTEVGGTSARYDDPWIVRLRTCGRVFDGAELEIRDPETRRALPPGEAGEIAMRSWWQMVGYHGQPEATAAVVDADGWMHTGDRGLLDTEGNLVFLGRFKDMMKVGGENVSAEEVESVLLSHPDVRQVAVIGIPDPRLEEVPMAFVEPVDGAASTAADLIAFCAARMANFRVPKQIEFVSEWPLTGSGKIQKHLLRARVEERG